MKKQHNMPHFTHQNKLPEGKSRQLLKPHLNIKELLLVIHYNRPTCKRFFFKLMNLEDFIASSRGRENLILKRRPLQKQEFNVHIDT